MEDTSSSKVAINACRIPVKSENCIESRFPMISSPEPHSQQPLRVALLVETTLESGRDILRGVARYVRERGPWSLLHAPGGFELLSGASLHKWKGDGIIARVTSSATAKALKRTKIPVVDVLGIVPDTQFPLVHVDDAAIAKEAVTHFIERGFRHFAFMGLIGEHWSERRRDAFLLQTRALGAIAAVHETTRDELIRVPWDRRQSHLASWLAALPKPTGLMVCSDQCGVDLLEACQRIQIDVPNEIAVVGVDNDAPLCEICSPPLSSISPNHQMVGYTAARLLHQLILGEKPPQSPQFIAPSRLIVRHSSDILAVEDKAVAAALKIIQAEAGGTLSVDKIARHAGVSRSVLQRRFHHALGRTIHDQIIGIRLKMAIELIGSTSLPLVEIAERCGFVHQEYMGVVFRQRLNRTPSTYRTSADF